MSAGLKIIRLSACSECKLRILPSFVCQWDGHPIPREPGILSPACPLREGQIVLTLRHDAP